MYNVSKYVLRSGAVHAVLWTGKAECLVGFPDFNTVVASVRTISPGGTLHLIARGINNYDVEDIAPHQAYIVWNPLGYLEVWGRHLFQQYYKAVPETDESTVLPHSEE